ncbi:TPA: putative DNA binding domain-containing protein [Mannheimia haemolytica]|uniref:Transcriptional regulator n=2 Tax=Mannheimia haemolytica TaxID=75985 RepID=A0A547EA86_MANHA|nr:RNA-binding domain-containing protein [Mannheimia haemolytica]AWW70622.1 transcriptional regulator [Pasteurellaceae bacterium 12565]AGI31688.1 transcriptional regulator [Mannheimia haemolytica USDA-ARS-USMARC-183]AGI36203.1 transcriptional regulator [Mannheimia haemolytica USDA-ARS-USMARC-185]AGK00673.1 putative HTH domain-containing transcriptional regulator [Mannheimia haemolytica M42548]AGQ41086.1 transcriptional regulator [Mannheimia haemolytica D174]
MLTWEHIEKMIAHQQFIREKAEIEYKEAKNSVPKDLWHTYSAFANSNGGFILLGIKENEQGHFPELLISGVNDPDKVIDELFSQSRSEKVSKSLLKDNDVKIFQVENKSVIAIYVKAADILDRPIHLNGDYRLSYVRLNSGDHKLTSSELRSFISSYSQKDADGRIVPYASIDDISLSTLDKYRNLLKAHNSTSKLLTLSDEKLLQEIGAYKKDLAQNSEGITNAGLLMFGKHYAITSIFPHFFFEYYEEAGDVKRYTLRITDFDLEEGNLFEFYLKIVPLIQELGKDKHFKLDNLTRTEENEITDGLREALINAITHADYFNNVRHLKVIKTKDNKLIFENAGVMLVDIPTAIAGQRSECRNSIIHNLFHRLGLCERQGQGVRDIYSYWQSRNFNSPLLESEIDYTKLTLTFQSGMIADFEEKFTACFGENFSELQPIQKDCLLFIAFNQGKAMFAELAQKLPQYPRRNITLALARLKEKGLLTSSGSPRKQLYTLVNLEWIITEKSQDDYFNPPFDQLDKASESKGAPPKKSKVKQVKQLPQNKANKLPPK